MKSGLSIVLLAVILFAATQANAADATFRPVNVYADSGNESLAAYQIEVTTGAECAEIVGVEGGDHRAFHAAPYYDPTALRGGRIIIGAFSTATDLPHGKTRVAVLHMRETSSPCLYEARVLAAASEREERIAIEVSLQPVNGGTDE